MERNPSADAIDVVLEQWRRQRPDLDLSSMAVFARLMLVVRQLEPAVEQVFARYGLRPGEFDVLAALRRHGPPFALTPSELADGLMLSRAGMTNRLDRLEAAGLIKRRLNRADRRSVRIVLTPTGREVIDATLTEHAANLARLAGQLSEDDAATLNRILRAMLRDPS